MSLSIGLEALKAYNGNNTVVNTEASYADFMESSAALEDQINYGEKLFTAFENLCAIRKTVKRYGFTKSLESLIGNSLGSTTAAISTEAEDGAKGVWQKIVDWFKKIWRYIADFFAKLFNTRRGMMLKIKKLTDNLKDYEFSSFKGIDVAELAKRGENLLNMSKELSDISLTEATAKRYGDNVLAAMKEMDAAQIFLKKAVDAGIKIANRGIGDPEADVAEARRIQGEAKEKLKSTKEVVDAVMKSGRNYYKAAKKKKK